MERIATTPFGQRPVTAGLIEQMKVANAPAPVPHMNKWELFRALTTARMAYGVTDRDLTVLNALLSFRQDTNLSDNANLIVFPSNVALSERAHGMAESTLRRHLAALIRAGLIHRHDSPNGKRYASRGAEGDINRAFGFDLRPLLVQARDITHAATEATAASQRLKRLREDVSLLKRDALKLVVYGQESGAGGPWAAHEAALLDIHKQMRRNMAVDVLTGLAVALKGMLSKIRALLVGTEEMNGSDANNKRHYHNSKPDSYESELCEEKNKGEMSEPEIAPIPKAGRELPNLPLALVLKACPDIIPYAPGKPRHWHELVALAGFVRGMMGISPDAWEEAQTAMGPEVAAVTVAGILQRVSGINSPGGYLRALTRKAETDGFSPGPMIMALLRPEVQAA